MPRMRRQTRITPAERKDTAGMREPRDRHPALTPGTRPPEYVIETWVSERLRDRIQRNGTSLAEALQATDTQKRPPEAELEAEP